MRILLAVISFDLAFAMDNPLPVLRDQCSKRRFLGSFLPPRVKGYPVESCRSVESFFQKRCKSRAKGLPLRNLIGQREGCQSRNRK